MGLWKSPPTATKNLSGGRGGPVWKPRHLKNPLPEQPKPAEFQQVQSAALAAGPNPTRRISAGLIRCTCSRSKPKLLSFSHPTPMHLLRVQSQPYRFQPLAEFVEPAATTWLDAIFSCCSPGLSPNFPLLSGQLDVLLSLRLGARMLPFRS